MTPKEYFSQLLKLDNKIQSKLRERDAIRRTLVKSTDTTQEPIQTNQTSNPTENVVIKLLKYTDETNNYVDELVDLRIQIADEIMELRNDNYRIVLSERYIQGKKFEEIAVEQNYAYRHITRLHGEALKEFEKLYPEKFTE